MSEREDPAAAPAEPFPWVCAAIIVTAVLVYALRLYFGSRADPRADRLAIELQFGALYAPAVARGEWFRLITYAFSHGSPVHLGFNMFATTALGVPLERRIGSARFLQVTFVTGLGAAAVHADILQVGHHGSKTSSRRAFLAAVKPHLALVSSGPKHYGKVVLPDPEVIEALKSLGAQVLRTDERDANCPVEHRIGGDSGPGGCDSYVITIEPPAR